MAGPKDFSVRPPAVAGRFYPAEDERCRQSARKLLQPPPDAAAPAAWGGIVPHAGWICSGAIAGQTVAALARSAKPDVVVVFGAVHTPVELPVAALATYETWSVPGGQSTVARDVSERLGRLSDLFLTDDRLHVREHAVEVELPLIQAAWPEARLLPVEVPLVEDAAMIGRRTAEQVLNAGLRPVFLASSDLTHYGPSYRFAPAGVGVQGLGWAKENDRRLLSLVTEMAVERIVPEVRERANACGGGAIAAMLEACKAAGATSASVLRHANSFETLAEVAPQAPIDAVGYASVVVG